jgi:predicted nucleic acid-binding protein
MPAAILDTNAVSDLMRDHALLKARIATPPDPIGTSVVVVGDLVVTRDLIFASIPGLQVEDWTV